MNIQDLKYYHELLKQKNYTKTAQIFGVSQPTISAAVKRLEAQFGGQFLIRNQSHQKIIVTKLGMQFDEHVQSILKEMNVAQKEIKQCPDQDILFGLPPIIGDHYFPQIAPQLLSSHILNHLKVLEHGSYELQEMLTEGRINIALLGNTDQNIASKLDIKVLKKFPIQVIVNPNHPWAKRKGVYFKELKDQSFITLTEDYVHAKAIDEMTKKEKLALHPVYESPDVPIVKSLVAKNLGISYLTTFAINSHDKIVSIPLLDKYQPSFLLVAAKRKNYILNEKEEKLWDTLK